MSRMAGWNSKQHTELVQQHENDQFFEYAMLLHNLFLYYHAILGFLVCTLHMLQTISMTSHSTIGNHVQWWYCDSQKFLIPFLQFGQWIKPLVLHSQYLVISQRWTIIHIYQFDFYYISLHKCNRNSILNEIFISSLYIVSFCNSPDEMIQ